MSQYSENQFVQSENHSWSLLFQYIDNGAKVLDVGCSSGTFGEALIRDKGCTVDGIELFHDDAALARKKLRDVYECNVELDDLKEITDTYDFIVFADVIEHLLDPVSTLSKMKELLTPKGLIIYSIPNMAHISIRLDLMRGNFTYTKTGLLDETHLHFYTKKHIESTFAEAGYVIKDQKYTYMNYPIKFIGDRLETLGLTINDESKFDEIVNSVEAQAFQFIGCATATATKNKHRALTNLPHQKDAEVLNKKLQDYENTIHELRKTAADQQYLIGDQSNKLQTMQNSWSWRAMELPRKFVAKINKR